jgi:RHS repeat-associated protein
MAPTDFGYTGQRDVPSTGLMYYRARFYHPALGRFVSADTIVPEPGQPQDFNRYSYVRNSPVNLVDPNGHAPCVDQECNMLVSPANGNVMGAFHLS